MNISVISPFIPFVSTVSQCNNSEENSLHPYVLIKYVIAKTFNFSNIKFFCFFVYAIQCGPNKSRLQKFEGILFRLAKVYCFQVFSVLRFHTLLVEYEAFANSELWLLLELVDITICFYFGGFQAGLFYSHKKL